MRQALARIVEQHPVIIYTLARLVLFLGVLLPLYLLGMRGFVLLGLALVLSGVLSLVLLNGVRSRFSGVLSGYFSGLNQRIDDAARAEDDDDSAPSGHQRQSQA
jgi:hypothetical protein